MALAAIRSRVFGAKSELIITRIRVRWKPSRKLVFSVQIRILVVIFFSKKHNKKNPHTHFQPCHTEVIKLHLWLFSIFCCIHKTFNVGLVSVTQFSRRTGGIQYGLQQNSVSFFSKNRVISVFEYREVSFHFVLVNCETCHSWNNFYCYCCYRYLRTHGDKLEQSGIMKH